MQVAMTALSHRAAPISGRVREVLGDVGKGHERAGSTQTKAHPGTWRTPKPSPNCIPRELPLEVCPLLESLHGNAPPGPGTLPPHHP